MVIRVYRNSEGYPDPTAGQAIANIMREQKRAAKAKRRKAGQKAKKNAARTAAITGNNRGTK